MYMIMTKWRNRQMSNDQIAEKMIEFIQEKERQLQVNKLATDGTAKTDIVKAILDELERVSKDEN